jgi:hypothetical protein
MYKLEMKIKHQNKTQSHKKRKMQQQSTTFSSHHHRQKNKTLVGRPNQTGRPSSPVTIIARKKTKKQNKTRFFFIAGRPNPTGRSSSPVTIIARKKKKNKLSSSSSAGQT